jgi:hypothetical protein
LKKNNYKANQTLALRKDAGKVLENIRYWEPPVPVWKTIKKKKSNLKIAAIVSDRLYHGIRFEGEILLLTPENWVHTLCYGKPDFLLVESTWETSTGHWDMAQIPVSSEYIILHEIVRLAQQRSIPTVFWNTKDCKYHELYKDFCRYFDFVFCADIREVELLRKDGIRAEVLLPCVQPALYNPFRIYDYYDAFKIGVLFDGWVDIEKYNEHLEVLKEMKKYDLAIIESRYIIFSKRINNVTEFKDYFRGCVTEQARMVVLKYAKFYISFDHSISHRTTQVWAALEAAACHTPVLHNGNISDDDIRCEFAIIHENKEELLNDIKNYYQDEIPYNIVAHKSWRQVISKHTFAHRLQSICQSASINHDWMEYPKVSIITPTYRQEQFKQCIKNYDNQTYPQKELIIIYNNNSNELPRLQELTNTYEDIRFIRLPEEYFAGACLHIGNIYATGEYCFRMDDDDTYGANYILDMILGLSSLDATLFGKPPAVYAFEDEEAIYSRNAPLQPFTIIDGRLLKQGKIWFGGNTMAWNRLWAEKNIMFGDTNYGSADSFIQFTVPNNLTSASMDPFNIVTYRSNDPSKHTWKLDTKILKKGSSFLSNSRQDILF